MKWKDIKLTTLQKMFAAEGNTIPNDESTQDYLAGMPAVANEALQMIATAGKYLIKKTEIAHYPAHNLLGEYGKKIHRITEKEITLECDAAHAYYFEYYGDGILHILVNGVEKVTQNIVSRKSFSPFKGLIDNPDSKGVCLRIESEYMGALKSAALYAERFFSDDDVQPETERIPYDLNEIVNDFYAFDVGNIYYEGDVITESYIRFHNMYDESGHVILLPRDMAGNYTIYYRAYPEVITVLTEDDYELEVDREVAVILPLYMASQLYKDDDNGIATAYRNEFEVALERLKNRPGLTSSEKFTSESGWI